MTIQCIIRGDGGEACGGEPVFRCWSCGCCDDGERYDQDAILVAGEQHGQLCVRCAELPIECEANPYRYQSPVPCSVWTCNTCGVLRPGEFDEAVEYMVGQGVPRERVLAHAALGAVPCPAPDFARLQGEPRIRVAELRARVS